MNQRRHYDTLNRAWPFLCVIMTRLSVFPRAIGDPHKRKGRSLYKLAAPFVVISLTATKMLYMFIAVLATSMRKPIWFAGTVLSASLEGSCAATGDRCYERLWNSHGSYTHPECEKNPFYRVAPEIHDLPPLLPNGSNRHEKRQLFYTARLVSGGFHFGKLVLGSNCPAART